MPYAAALTPPPHPMSVPRRLLALAVASTSIAALLPPALASSPPSASPREAHIAARPFSPPAPLAQPLRHKMEGPAVRELQIRLRHAKYLAAYDANDRFGAQTRAGVEKFQREHGLRATGVVDQATWDALRAKSFEPTAAELNNTDVGPWFTGPQHAAFIMELQDRLRQAGLYQGVPSGVLDDATRQAIAAWRVKSSLPASDVMDERSWTPLIAATRNPRYAQLFGAPPASTLTQQLDARCATGRVVCISKGQETMSYVVDGQVQFTREARFSRPGWDSPVGEFRIWYKNNDTVSKIFGERTPMPYAIFYHGNVAIHFSDDFAENGYTSGSHGCSQLRDYPVAKWLYEQVKVGDRVVVYE